MCSSSALFRSAREREGLTPPPVAFLVVVADDAGVRSIGVDCFFFFFLDGGREDVDVEGSSFVGLRFGIAPEPGRTVGANFFASFDVASARCSRVREMPRSFARSTTARSME